MKIHGHDIFMVRGDDEFVTVKLREKNNDGSWTVIKLTSSDTIVLNIGTYTGSKSVDPTIVKTITDVTCDATTGAASIHIKPDDTALLDLGSNKYVYTVKITFNGTGYVKHLFPYSSFVLG